MELTQSEFLAAYWAKYYPQQAQEQAARAEAWAKILPASQILAPKEETRHIHHGRAY